MYWERIASHFNSACISTEDRSSRSLETKWGQIKHDISDFIGVVSQVRRLHKSGISKADVIQCAHKIYKNKNPKNVEFGFEHCWCLVKGFPHGQRDGETCGRARLHLHVPFPLAMLHKIPFPSLAALRRVWEIAIRIKCFSIVRLAPRL